MARATVNPDFKYELYERSVQSPKHHADWVVSIYKEIRGRYARHLREDFCGTFAVSSEWVRRNRRNTAVCLDLDPEPLRYGKKTHLTKMNADQRGRLTALRQNVVTVTPLRSDVTIAFNFSFFIFKERRLLLQYLRSSLRSLKKDGILIMDVAGGPGMIEKLRERKVVSIRGARASYVWDQQSFDPITHDARYAIHFRLSDGRRIENAFTYDWRLWSIPEIRDAMAEAGFAKTVVYWETTHKGEGTGEYAQMKHGDNSYAWVAYVVGIKGR